MIIQENSTEMSKCSLQLSCLSGLQLSSICFKPLLCRFLPANTCPISDKKSSIPPSLPELPTERGRLPMRIRDKVVQCFDILVGVCTPSLVWAKIMVYTFLKWGHILGRGFQHTYAGPGVVGWSLVLDTWTVGVTCIVWHLYQIEV